MRLESRLTRLERRAELRPRLVEPSPPMPRLVVRAIEDFYCAMRFGRGGRPRDDVFSLNDPRLVVFFGLAQEHLGQLPDDTPDAEYQRVLAELFERPLA